MSTKENVLKKYLDDIGTIDELSPEDIKSEDLGIPKDRDLYRLADIEGLNDLRSQYTVRQKLQAVTVWMLTGSPKQAADKAGVTENAIKYWKRETAWWKEAVARIKLQRNEKLDADLTRCMDKSIYAIIDRIDNGDEIVLKDGRRMRQKLKGRDLAVMFSILHDKRALMRGEASSSKSERNTQSEVLNQLKESFEKLSTDINQRLEEKVVSEQ